MAQATNTNTCGWNCGDTTENHHHYAVLARDAATGKLLGRLTPDGCTTTRNLYAAILSKAKAEAIAKEITERGEFTAKAIKF